MNRFRAVVDPEGGQVMAHYVLTILVGLFGKARRSGPHDLFRRAAFAIYAPLGLRFQYRKTSGAFRYCFRRQGVMRHAKPDTIGCITEETANLTHAGGGMFSMVSFFLLGILSTTAITACAEKTTFTISNSSEVEEKIHKADPNERKQLTDAIRAGNTFVPHFFDGSVLNRDFEFEEWKKVFGPLVKDVRSWEVHNVFPESSPLPLEEWRSGDKQYVCPQIVLTGIVAGYLMDEPEWKNKLRGIFAADRFVLEYRAKIVGTGHHHHEPTRYFVPNSVEQYRTVFLGMDENYKISKIATRHLHPNDFPLTPDQRMRNLNREMNKKLEGDLASSEEKKKIAEEKKKLDLMIREIRQAEARICQNR
jgi:hypothetical protein